MFTSPPFLWALFGLLLIGAEFLVPGFVIFFFGLGAILTSISTLVFPFLKGANGLQALLWTGYSLATFILLRKKFSRLFKGKLGNKAVEDEPIGKVAVVTEEITPEKPGRILFQGTTWRAVSYTETFTPGQKVRILESDNLTYTVSGDFLPEQD